MEHLLGAAGRRQFIGVVRRFALLQLLQNLQRGHFDAKTRRAQNIALLIVRVAHLCWFHILRMARARPVSHKIPFAGNDVRMSVRINQRRRYVRNVLHNVIEVTNAVVVQSHLSLFVHWPLHLRGAVAVHCGHHGRLRHHQKVLQRRFSDERSETFRRSNASQ